MSNVWLLEKGEDYEGGSVLGIYSTEELAMEALVEQRNKQLGRERGPSEIDRGGFYSGCDWWRVSAWTVDEEKEESMTSKAMLAEEVERLTEITQQLAEMLRERIDECTKLEEELEMLGPLIKLVEVTTDFGPDIVFATVKCMCDIPFVQTEVVSWSLDGQPQPLDSLKGEDELTLRQLAIEKYCDKEK